MIIVLGGKGYIGQAFHRELIARGENVLPLSRKQVDYSRYETLVRYLRDYRPRFLINAAGHTGQPNVDVCELSKADTLLGNTLFPLVVSHACQAAGVPWGQVSTGCIYTGAKIDQEGSIQIETDLMKAGVRELVQAHSGAVRGFHEEDSPNFSFRHPPCSFYSGTKALSEESLENDKQVYLWRLRIPFDEYDNPRNYLTKLLRYSKTYENFNSLSHRGDFVRACLDLYTNEAPYGTYNVTNPGYVSTRQVVEMIQNNIAPKRDFEYWTNDEEFYRTAAKTPRSNCILDVSKLLSTGVRMRPVEEAIQASLERWCWESPKTENTSQEDDYRIRSVIRP